MSDTGGVVFVPAFTGLGAPHWDPAARGLVAGLTRGTTRAHLARATLEALAFQTRDVVDAMAADAGLVDARPTLRVDGGAARNPVLLQMLADALGAPVERPALVEATAWGAAALAGIAAGLLAPDGRRRAMWRADARVEPDPGVAAAHGRLPRLAARRRARARLGVGLSNRPRVFARPSCVIRNTQYIVW